MTTNRLLKSALVNTVARLISVSAVMMGGFASARAAYADAIIIHDRFNGSGGLTARHPDTNVPNSAWSVTGSGASVWNAQAWAGGADWAGIFATIDSGVSDGTIAVDWNPSGDMPCGELVARATDAANYIAAYYWSGTLYLSRVASTGNVLLASTSMDDPGTSTHRLKMVLNGSSIQVWYDGVRRLSATDAFNVAATKHGFRWLSYYNWQSTYSNFEVDGNFVPTAATVTVTPTPTTVPLFHSITLTATAYDNAHNVIPNMNFSWATSNATAVTVASATGNTATVTGTGAGNATITATPVLGSSSTATVTVNTGLVAVFDTFTGADTTALAAHTPEVNGASGTWSTTGSGVFLSGNRATAGGGDWIPITASIDSGIADGTVEADWTPADIETSAASVVARMTDANNYLIAHYWSDSLWLYRVSNGQYTLLGQTPVANAGTTTHHLALKMAGAALEVWWDGVQQIVASDAFNRTATRHGFRWYSWWDSLCTYDRFEVSALPTIASVTVSPASATIAMNGGRMFTAQALDAASQPIPGVSFTWQSSNSSVVSMRVASATTGAAISEGPGNASITAIAFGGGAQLSVGIIVTPSLPPPPPPPPPCLGGLFPSSVTWPADGGIGQITVSAQSNCDWSVDWNAPWITPLQTSGTGNTVLSFAVDRNDSGVARSASLNVGGATFAISQTTVFTGNPPSGSSGGGPGGSRGGNPGGGNSTPAMSCAVTVSPTAFRMPSGGGVGLLAVNADPACAWRVQGVDTWLTVTPLSGVGPAFLTVSAGVASFNRFGRIYISGQAIALIMQTRPQHAGVLRAYSQHNCWYLNINIGLDDEIEDCDDDQGPEECTYVGLNPQGVPVLECASVDVTGKLPSPDPVLPDTDWCDLLPELCADPPPDPCATMACEAPTEPQPAPTPRASFEVRCYKSIRTWPYSHCYLVTWTAEAGKVITEAGPEETAFVSTLHMWNSPVFPDEGHSESDKVWFQNHDIDPSAVACIKRTAYSIDQTRVPYVADPGPNSNSAIGTTLAYCGLSAMFPSDALGSSIYVSFAPQ